MSELTVLYTTTEIESIKAALERLFVLQDKGAGARKVDLFVEEILNNGFPFGAILAGIRDLQHENLQQIKLGTILESIRNKIHYEAPADEPRCNYCDGMGMVSLANEKGYAFSFACVCAKGGQFEKSFPLQRWNGRLSQNHNKHIFKIVSAGLRDVVLEKIKKTGGQD